MFKKILLIAILVMVGVGYAPCQPLSESRFDNYTQENGLSNNLIQCIYQDKEGWIWFGTSQGLNQYDGYRFKKYNNEGPKGMAGILVRSIYQDHKGNYWVGTENGGLNKFDLRKESFEKIPLTNSQIYSANSISEDKNGRLWIGTDKGLAYLNKAGRLSYYNPNDLLGITNIKKIWVDRNNRLWIGSSQQGLYLIDPKRNHVQVINLPNNNHLNDEVQTIYESKDGTIWVGTYYTGIYKINPRTKIAERLKSYPQSERRSTVRAIIEDREGYLWIGSRDGLLCYDRKSETYSQFRKDITNNISLIHNSVLSLYLDTNGDLWVGTRGGISYRTKEKQDFRLIQESKNDNRYLSDEDVYGITEDSRGRYWLGTEDGGINLYDPQTQRFRYLTKANGLSTNCIKCFLQNGNEMWVGTYMGGINIVDINSLQVKKIIKQNDREDKTQKSNNIWQLLKDHYGDIWIATSKGVYRYRGGGGIEKMDKIAQDNEVVSVTEDKDGDLWFCSFDETIVWCRKTDRLIRYAERCRVVHQDNEKRFWMGTFTKGIALYNKYSGPLKYYGENQGLANNSVETITEDGNYLWIATDNGLSRLDKKRRTLKNYDKEDGLQDVQFHYNAACKKRNNEIILGGIHGINIFAPDKIHDNPFNAPIEITDLRIFNQSVKPGKELDENIETAKEITLSYNQNMITIGFAALSYSKSGKNQYMYKMEGFDNDWIMAGEKNEATYTNLDPGTYVFKIRSANCDGKWSKTEKEIIIHITPPFYRTWWFELILTLLIGYVVYATIKFYLHKKDLQNELKIEKVQTQKQHELEEMKLQFFTNISHELRTPLTLILGPLSQILGRKETDEETQEDARLAEKNANHLLRIVNQLLDFRKVEVGKLETNYTTGDLVRFIDGIVKNFRPLAETKGLKLSYHAEIEKLLVQIDEDKIEKICNNLLSNAIKYTQEGGIVQVGLKREEQHTFKNGQTGPCYLINVKDNGQGIKKENAAKVFDLFGQNSTADSAKGTGIGLALTRDFVQLMKGDIELESEEGKGSNFTIILPLKEITEPECTPAPVNTPNDEKETETVPYTDKKMLLIVEDNEELRHFMVRHFSSTYEVIEAADGEEGEETATEKLPDVIITDLIMPKRKGDELCDHLKKDERTSHIPIIMLTAIKSKQTEIDTLKAGADDYITKPFDVKILDQKVSNLIERQEKMRKHFKLEQIMKPNDVTLESPDEKFMKKAMKVIEDNLGDADFDIEQFAKEVGVSRMQLYRKIDALTNMTVKELIRSIRIKRAYQLIEQDKLTISEVAYEVGFKDIAYFRKCFKAQIGKNPSEINSKN